MRMEILENCWAHNPKVVGSIPTPDKPNGIYFLNVTTKEESFTQKIIIQK